MTIVFRVTNYFAVNAAATRKAIDQTLDTYRDLLDTLSDEQFVASPNDGGWSIAEIYSHILQATLGSTIAAERCINGTCDVTGKGLNWLGRFVMFFRQFPVKIKTPAETSARMPAAKISKEDARNLIIKCRQRLDTITPRLAEENGIHKIKHPRLGMMNASQWFLFILIHLKHHLKQISRTQNKFQRL